MDLKYAFKRLNKLNFKQVIELVENHPYYVREDKKEGFLKELAKAGDHFATEDWYKARFIETVEKYYDDAFFKSQPNVSKPIQNDYDSEARIIIDNIIFRCNIMAKVCKLVVWKPLVDDPNYHDEITDMWGKLDFDDLVMLSENCDLYTTPEQEHEFVKESMTLYEQYQSTIFSLNPDESKLEEYRLKVIKLIHKYLNLDMLNKKIEERTKYQYCDKSLLNDYLHKMNRKQLLNLYLIVVNYRHSNQLFMSSWAKTYFFEEINEDIVRQNPKLPKTATPEFGAYLKEKGEEYVLDVLKNVPDDVLIRAFLKYSNLNLVLWDNVSEALLNCDDPRQAWGLPALTLSVKNLLKEKDIEVLM